MQQFMKAHLNHALVEVDTIYFPQVEAYHLFPSSGGATEISRRIFQYLNISYFKCAN